MKHKNKKPGNLAVKIASYTVLILIAITFIGAPLITLFTNPQRNTSYGSYAGTPIRYDEQNYFGRSIQAQINFLQQQFGSQGLSDSFIQLARRSAYKQTVEMMALMNIAKQNKYYISDDKINTIIKKIPSLQSDGAFDIEIYKSIPAETRKKIVEVQKQIALSSTIRDDLISPELISEKEKEFLKMLNNDKRVFSFVVFNHEDITNKDILTQYVQNNKDLFTQYEISSLTVTDEDEANTIKQRIENNESSFEEEVASYSIDSAKENEGKRGALYAYQISEDESEEALQVINDLEKSSLSSIIRNNNGNYAFYTRTSTKEIDINNTEELAIVQSYLNTYDPSYLEEEVMRDANAFIAEAKKTSFNTAIDNNNYTLHTTKAFPININDISLFDSIESPSDKEQESLALLSKESHLLQDIFALPKEAVSNAYTLDNKTYILYVQNIIKVQDEEKEKADNRIAAFIRSYKTSLLQDYIIDKKKWVNNFDEVINNN